ncbi:MAG TPA: hypothetical protein VGE76_12430 [Opitutaceae bacterium]
MEITQGRHATPASIGHRRSLIGAVALGLLALVTLLPHAAQAGAPSGIRHTREYFRSSMPATVHADHPAIQPVVAAIRALTTDPLQQLVVVNDISHLLIDYDDDKRVYGSEEFHATFDEMLARRREAGWVYLRDDCDGRAVFAAHLLAALGIPWRLEASYWKEHAWIVAKVGGVEYDLLDLRAGAPETNNLSYKLVGRHFVRPSKRPPAFAWRKAWAQRTHRNFDLGMTLGLLAIDSTPAKQYERFATDWTTRAPNSVGSPVEDRFAKVTVAGFPYGEQLNPGVMVAQAPSAAEKPASMSASVAAAASDLGVTTSSKASGAP